MTTLVDPAHWRMSPANAANPGKNRWEPTFVTAHYMYAMQPDAKIIVILRDPTERFAFVVYYQNPYENPYKLRVR